MKTNRLVLFLLAAMLSSNLMIAQTKPYNLSDNESIKRIYSGIDVLASDSLLGREAGTKGGEMSADFIAAEFKMSGLKEFVGDSSYFHYFDFRDGITYEKGTYFILNKKKYHLNKDYYPISISANGEVTGEIVNARKGIIDPEKNINEFANAKVDNPVFVVQMEISGDDDYFLMKAARKARLAKENGGKAIIFINTNKELANPKPNFNNAMQLAEIPVVFAEQAAVKVLLDATLPKVSLGVNIADNIKRSRNVVGFIDNHLG